MGSRDASGRPDEVVFRIPSKGFNDPTSKVLKTMYSEIRKADIRISLTLSPRAIHCYSLSFLPADYCAWAVFDLGDNYGYVAESYGVQMIPL